MPPHISRSRGRDHLRMTLNQEVEGRRQDMHRASTGISHRVENLDQRPHLKK